MSRSARLPPSPSSHGLGARSTTTVKRRARTNSVDADLAELAVLHQAVRSDRGKMSDLLTDEQRVRHSILSAEDVDGQRLYGAFAVRRKQIAAAAVHEERRSRPPPVVAAMGELFLENKALEREQKQHAANRMLRQRQRHAERTRGVSRRLEEKQREENSTYVAQHRDVVAVARARHRAAVEFQREALRDRRQKDAADVASSRRAVEEQLSKAAAVRIRANRDHVAKERAASASPALFLQLPPLHREPSNEPRSPRAARPRKVAGGTPSRTHRLPSPAADESVLLSTSNYIPKPADEMRLGSTQAKGLSLTVVLQEGADMHGQVDELEELPAAAVDTTAGRRRSLDRGRRAMLLQASDVKVRRRLRQAELLAARIPLPKDEQRRAMYGVDEDEENSWSLPPIPSFQREKVEPDAAGLDEGSPHEEEAPDEDSQNRESNTQSQEEADDRSRSGGDVGTQDDEEPCRDEEDPHGSEDEAGDDDEEEEQQQRGPASQQAMEEEQVTEEEG